MTAPNRDSGFSESSYFYIPKYENDLSNENSHSPFLKSDDTSIGAMTEICFVIDAFERRVCLMERDEQRRTENRYFYLETISQESYERYGIVIPEDEVDEDLDNFVHCDICDKCYNFSCLEHPLYQCNDRPCKGHEDSEDRGHEDIKQNDFYVRLNLALKTLPAFLHVTTSSIPNAGKGVFTKVDIPCGIVFGPYEGILRNDSKIADPDGYSWELRRGIGRTPYFIDGHDARYSNWMRFINSSRFEGEQNVIAFQYNGSVFYRVFKAVDRDQELLVWYGPSYARSLLGANTTLLKERKIRKIKCTGKNPYIF